MNPHTIIPELSTGNKNFMKLITNLDQSIEIAKFGFFNIRNRYSWEFQKSYDSGVVRFKLTDTQNMSSNQELSVSQVTHKLYLENAFRLITGKQQTLEVSYPCYTYHEIVFLIKQAINSYEDQIVFEKFMENSLKKDINHIMKATVDLFKAIYSNS